MTVIAMSPQGDAAIPEQRLCTSASWIASPRVPKPGGRDDDGGFGPNAGETFQACVGTSIFEKAPFTTMSRFMLNNVLIEGRARPSRPESNPDPSKDPIAWLNAAIGSCGL